MTTTFNQQEMTSEMGKARSLWTIFARRAQSACALSAASQALLALSHEMEAYEQYRLIERAMSQEEEEPIDLHDYERVLIALSCACDEWWKTIRLLQTVWEQTLPAAFANKEALITACLEQRLRLIKVSLHLLTLQLSNQEQQKTPETLAQQKGAEWHG